MRISRRSLLQASLAAPWVATRAVAADVVAMELTTQRIGRISPDFMGLGYEASSVAIDGLLSANNRSYVQLVRNLGRQGVIRIGGNVSDFSTFDARGRSASLPKATILTLANLRQLRTFLDATGWSLIWGLNLGADRLDNAVEEARAVAETMGPRLLALEIGNEPDLFPRNGHRQPNYGYAAWLADYRRYKTAIRAVLPRVPLAGPDAAGAVDWVENFARDEGRDISLLTAHHYITGQANPDVSIPLMLQEEKKYQPALARFQAAAVKAQVPYRICETASFSGGGRLDVSDTFAAALWALDYLFVLASNGCSGVNMETGVNHLGWISHYTPIGDDLAGHYSPAPEYYGLLAFAQVGRGNLMAVSCNSGGMNLTSYATDQGDGRTVLTVINKDPTRNAAVQLHTPSQLRRGEIVGLTAPSLQSKAGIVFGGSSVLANGIWGGGRPSPIQISGRDANFEVPAASAALVTLVG